jgi:NADH-quinone oxidoreductase subunit N
MSVFMLALLGFPIFGGIGFFAKWYVLQAALQAPYPQTKLAIWLVITSVVSAGYYLYVVMVMFMRPRAANAAVPPETPAWSQFVMVACAASILVIGVMPQLSVAFFNAGLPRIEPPTAAVSPAMLHPADLIHTR